MLVLSRKDGEVICIGNDVRVRVMVVDIRGDKVRLGISAPNDVEIDRMEVRKAKERERQIDDTDDDGK